MSASADDVIAALPSHIGRRCLFIERPTMSLADVVSASVNGDMFRVSLAAATDAQLVCDIDDDYSFNAAPSMPYGERWDVSMNLNDFYLDTDYWDGSRYGGWRIIFDTDVLDRFLVQDLSWMEDWF